MNRRRSRTAAIFDLDRTLIGGPSGPVFSAHLGAAGIQQRNLPGADLVSLSYRLLGETAITAPTAQLAARATAGWPVDAVRAAAEAAADELEAHVQPYAPGVIADHRKEGRVLVMATTSPEPLVTPFADRLGFDAVVATRWSSEDGAYTGRIDGSVVWGRGKLEAVRAWADDAGVDLAGSWAYSDSYYDAPLLDAVAHPTAVNADIRLVALARLKGWPLRHFDLPDGVLKIAGRELQAWTRPLQRPATLPNVRLDIAGLENIPTTGPVIAVFNHRSYLDGSHRRCRARPDRAIVPVPRQEGGVRRPGRRLPRQARRGDPRQPLIGLERAARARHPCARSGEAVAMAPEGTIPRGPAFFDPVLKGRWGAARLAQATHASVVPVGLWGTEKVWPRNQRLPRLDLREPAPIRVRIGEPVDVKHRSLDADTKRIMAAIVEQLPDEARVQRTPTDEELMATFPPGYKGDPTRESGAAPEPTRDVSHSQAELVR